MGEVTSMVERVAAVIAMKCEGWTKNAKDYIPHARAAIEGAALALLVAGILCSAYGWLPQFVCMAMVVPGAMMAGINQGRRT